MSAVIKKNKSSQTAIEAEKNELAIKLLSTKDETIVHTINLIFDELTRSNSKRASLVQYNKEIESSVKKVRSGKSISNDEAMRQMDKW